VIGLVVADVRALEKEVEALGTTTRKAKDYLYLDEMLTRNLIKLDVIETEGREDVRQARKDCIKLIQATISKLEAKAPTEQRTEDMEVGTLNENPLALVPVEGSGGKDESPAAPAKESPAPHETPMEVTPTPDISAPTPL
jgi:hypothetical protein